MLEKYSGIDRLKLAQDEPEKEAPKEDPTEEAPEEAKTDEPETKEPPKESTEGEEDATEEAPAVEEQQLPEEQVYEALKQAFYQGRSSALAPFNDDVIRDGIWMFFRDNISQVEDPNDPEQFKAFAIDRLREIGVNYERARQIVKSLIKIEF